MRKNKVVILVKVEGNSFGDQIITFKNDDGSIGTETFYEGSHVNPVRWANGDHLDALQIDNINRAARGQLIGE